MIFSESSKMNYSIQVPPRDLFEDPMTGISSPIFVNNQSFLLNANAGSGGIDSFIDSFSPIHRYLPSNEFPDPDILCDDLDVPVNGFSCDHFRMFDFKVRRCARGRSHDWTECPFAHPGEKARRRDPRKFLYSGTACPEFRKGNCKKGDSCEFAHGIFECWLHPSRYRTQPCKDGIGCRRRVCFFAHSPEQLRVLSGSGDSVILSPTSVLPSPPLSPPSDSQLGGGSFNSMNSLVLSMNNLNLGKMKMSSQWGVERRQGLSSPNGNLISGNRKYNIWSNNYEEEPVMERVESGRDLRNKMYAKLSKDNSLNQSPLWIPDVDWVSDLLK